ncbi:outer membrane biogenesis protein BamB [Anatilimnocola aggregata]|uniref:Outer membrane biogenesis protein BamB n=1 Tax=Anatilimnocola aggregata TaxID=2528021 RepID=A0A517Y5D1_9BACT|nr:PQQ-binding-like beta-propeller repeat protein [Anatilimnocola aggregata]QDU25454.1 outer membrane biogenesis protein BamB [Anatilimnocola aggregata]
MCCALLPINASAAEPAADSTWPGWRGPTHDGVATGAELIDKFPAEGPPVLWVRELGQGYAGFAASKSRLFTMSQSLYEQSLVCLNADSGETIWSTKLGWPYDGAGLYPGPRSTPVIADERVFYVTPQGVVGCAAAQTGELLWSLNFNEKFQGRGTEFGYSSSPLVIDGLVILPVGGESASVIALRASDGSLAWKSGTKPASYATPLPIEWQGHPLVVVLMQNSLACYHRQTGERWWELPLSNGYDEHAASPIYREPRLLIAAPFKAGAEQFQLVASEDGRRCEPARVWDSLQLSNDVASSVLVEETLFGFDLREAQSRLHRPSRGEFRALDWLTGEVRWSSQEPGQAQLIAADGKLVGLNDRGEVLLFRAHPDRYEELGRVRIFPDEVCWTPPALANNRLYLRTQTRAAAIYLGRQPLQTAASVLVASEVVRQERFDPGSLLGAERDYPATPPAAVELRHWYWFSCALIVMAVAISGLTDIFVRTRVSMKPQAGSPFASSAPSNLAHVVCWTLIFLGGCLGSWIVHHWTTLYVFSWPLALWAAYQLAIFFSVTGSRANFRSRARLNSYLAGAGLVVLAAVYFHLCRWLGLALEWCYLTGFVLSFPLAVPLAWYLMQVKQFVWFSSGIAYLVSFSAYYWTSVYFMEWWLR